MNFLKDELPRLFKAIGTASSEQEAIDRATSFQNSIANLEKDNELRTANLTANYRAIYQLIQKHKSAK